MTDTNTSEGSLHVDLTSGNCLGSYPDQLEENDLRIPDVEEDLGYFPLQLGQCLEKGRYCVVRKLGWGYYSTVWLARDRTDERFVSLKILNRKGTEELENGKSDELGLLRTIAGSNPSHRGFRYNLLFYDTFKLKSSYGEHRCIVTEVLGCSIGRLFEFGESQKVQQLPKVIRLIIRHILMALEYLHHECHIVHTDIKMDNILFRLKPLDDLIAHQLITNPSCICDYGPGVPLSETPIMSQPIRPTIDMLKSENLEVVLADVGRSHRRFHPLHEVIQPTALRAPEVILGAEWDTPVDIWNLGCIVAELFTGDCWLFPPNFLTGKWSSSEDHLACMTEVLQTKFDLEFLNKCKNKPKYFKEDGSFAHFTGDESPSDTVKAFLAEYSIIDDKTEREIAERFILRCLQLVPENRPTATELLKDPWLQDTKT